MKIRLRSGIQNEHGANSQAGTRSNIQQKRPFDWRAPIKGSGETLASSN